MLQIRKSSERGHFHHGWLKSFHSFSFGDYMDPAHMGFSSHRVINEDYIQAGKGFPTHGHRDMEIITYPISGAIEHKDSTGSSGVIYPYEVQKMTAGRGILHSEYNHLTNQETHLLQIWIVPHTNGLAPSYEQKNFKTEIQSGNATLLVSPNAEKGSLKIHQDAYLWAKQFNINEKLDWTLNSKRKYWLQVVKGNINVDLSDQSEKLQSGDAAKLEQESLLQLTALDSAEILLFDLN